MKDPKIDAAPVQIASAADRRVTLYFRDSDWLALAEVEGVLRATREAHHCLLAMSYYRDRETWRPGQFPGPNPQEFEYYPSALVSFWHHYADRYIVGPWVKKAGFESPGFVTLDGSGPLVKLIDVLHSGRLQNEERVAIIDRIRAETERTRAEARAQNLTTLATAISVLQALGFEAEAIRRALLRDRSLADLLAGPFAALDGYLEEGPLAAIKPGDPEPHEGATS